ncbi:hypothetical protein SDC9_152571 [bioreactor metagenome]|uniref:Uncharacterized protein n=1 Tax=bioreactor metagenome TaxID=1076179 RepID=A0A645ETF4_9ZZZZ
MVAKLSSMSIMSAASFETSVPVIPIATPMSAPLRAGASLTPSPVMATMCPFSLRDSIILSLCAGVTRAKTPCFMAAPASSCFSMPSISLPVTALSPSVMPTAFAMASAVTAWSPVIITGLMPAPLASFTASTLSSRGGSIIPHIPARMRLPSRSERSSFTSPGRSL